MTLPDADDAALLDVVVDVACALSEEPADPVAAAESPVAADVGDNAEPETAPAVEDVAGAESPVVVLVPTAAVADFAFVEEFAADEPASDGVDNRSELALEEADFETVNSPAACAVASVVSLSDDGTN